MTVTFKAIMFTDIVESASIHDQSVRHRIRDLLDCFTREAAAENGGTVVKGLGDGHLLTFDSAYMAVRAGLDLQVKIKEHNETLESSVHFQIRIGIDAGDVELAPDGDIDGHCVDMAKRVESAGKQVDSPVAFTERVRSLLPAGLVTYRKTKSAVMLKGCKEAQFLYFATSCRRKNRQPRRKLSAFLTDGFIQVLLPKFTLAREDDGIEIQLEIERKLEVLTTSREKSEFFEELATRGNIRKGLTESLKDFDENPGLRNRVFQTRHSPVRYASGGAMPVLRLDNVDYACLFYRDVEPVGWNIANGASDSYMELYDPERIIHREFGEEFIIANLKQKTLLFYDPGIENIGPAYQKAIIHALDRQYPAFRFKQDFKRDNLKIDWVGGFDSIRVRVEGHEKRTSNYFLSITPEDSSIEVDRIAQIHPGKNDLPPDTKSFLKDCAVLDGELKEGLPIGRVVGLFNLEVISKRLHETSFRPDFYFCECEPGDNAYLEKRVARAIRSIQKLRSDSQKEYYEQLKEKFDLCPITRSLLSRWVTFNSSHAARP